MDVTVMNEDQEVEIKPGQCAPVRCQWSPVQDQAARLETLTLQWRVTSTSKSQKVSEGFRRVRNIYSSPHAGSCIPDIQSLLKLTGL